MKSQEIPHPSPEDVAIHGIALELPQVNDASASNDKFAEARENSVLSRIEKIRYPRAKLEMALLVTGAKPAAIFNFSGLIKETIDLLSLPNIIMNKMIYVAKDPEAFEALMAAEAIEDNQQHRFELGKALGYPATALEAFTNGSTADLTDLQADAKYGRFVRLVSFVPSQAHWREELDAVREQVELVKDLVPEIYREIQESEKPAGSEH